MWNRASSRPIEAIEGKKKLIQELKKAAKDMEAVYLAADPDREGEAICAHLAEELQGKKDGQPAIYRVMFNEITKNAIQPGLRAPRRGEPEPGGRAAGAPRAGPAGGLQDLSAALGQSAPGALCRAGANRRAAADRRARARDPRLREARVLDDRRQPVGQEAARDRRPGDPEERRNAGDPRPGRGASDRRLR